MNKNQRFFLLFFVVVLSISLWAILSGYDAFTHPLHGFMPAGGGADWPSPPR